MDTNDSRLWRKALAMAHPDREGGDEEVFKFLQTVRAEMKDGQAARDAASQTGPGKPPGPAAAAAYHQAAARAATMNHPMTRKQGR